MKGETPECPPTAAMGNTQNVEKDSGGSTNNLKRYAIVDEKKVCFAVLLGSDQLPGKEPLKSVPEDLKLMENTLKDCQFQVTNRSLVEGEVAKFERGHLDGILNDLASVPELADYSCYLFYYSGHGCHDGILTATRECITFSEIVVGVGKLLKESHKPRIFIFDCCRSDCCNLQLNHDSLLSSLEDAGNYVSDSIICFSTLDLQSSWGTKSGSAFTLEFAQALEQFHKLLPITEIIAQASGRARGRFSSRYVPKLLKEMVENKECSKMVENLPQPVYYSHLNAILLLTKKSELYPTEDYNPSDELNRWFNDYLPYLEKKGGSQLEENSEDTSLGKGSSVFIMYAADACGSEKDNYGGVCDLAAALEKVGFTVYLDIWESKEKREPRSWLHWYIANIAQCDHVIVVCSPEMKMASTSTTDRRSILPLVWPTICSEMTRDQGTLKFYPVLLHVAADDSSYLPSVFGGTVYKLEGIPLEFNSELSDFSKLVRHMAGMPVDHPTLGEVKPLGPKQDTPPSLLGDLASLYKLPKGHRPVHHVTPPRPAIVPQQQPYVTSMQAPLPPHHHAHPHGTYPPPLHAGGPPLPGHPYPLSHPHSYPYPYPHPYSHSYPHPHPAAGPPLPRPVAVLSKPVGAPAVLWLTDHMIRWRFVGRYLKIEEAELERIEHDNRSNLREQCYQLLHRWQQMTPSHEATYQVLLDAVERGEGSQLKGQFLQHIYKLES